MFGVATPAHVMERIKSGASNLNTNKVYSTAGKRAKPYTTAVTLTIPGSPNRFVYLVDIDTEFSVHNISKSDVPPLIA